MSIAGEPVVPRSTTPVVSIGVRAPLVDGPEKVGGKALYAADFVEQNALVGRILRSPVAHANIVRLDTTKAEQLPGVAAIVTGGDVELPYGVLPIAMNEYAPAKGRVRYRGEPVAAVAARRILRIGFMNGAPVSALDGLKWVGFVVNGGRRS